MNGKQQLTARIAAALILAGSVYFSPSLIAQTISGEAKSIKLKLAFGHTAHSRAARTVQLISGSPGLTIAGTEGRGMEKNDRVGALSVLNCGAGDTDELIAELNWPTPSAPLRKLAGWKDGYSVNDDAMWGYLMIHGSPGQSARLKEDPWNKPDAPLLTIQLDKEGAQGFTI
ncbi:MAG TPA: hypothetical protein VFM90_03625, partial [Cyclobacteriaceae bacterium]|nr:hypothetical protein [Cyclobacteriaceae bacterium]